ncbi:NTF2 fold immunity protein [Pontibacter sp. G13]|uniref:NTF2 fold immunity protein n=1 Tax=Pontibacter sp. G13 TaxID=3074898 RepID=UPI00288B608D|nr:NTF2 fold immunity protein [Pontibacter sp. G13]WNJ17150.1 NTF2 fold immunity protein [Pontibacter sp. G13]
MKLFFTISILLLVASSGFAQNTDDRFHLDSISVAKLVDIAIENIETHNVINDDHRLINTKEKAIELAEFYLFDIYGKKEILNQKPYDIFLIKNHWLIKGTLKKGYKGGTFLIIFDSTNGKILQITHGK